MRRPGRHDVRRRARIARRRWAMALCAYTLPDSRRWRNERICSALHDALDQEKRDTARPISQAMSSTELLRDAARKPAMPARGSSTLVSSRSVAAPAGCGASAALSNARAPLNASSRSAVAENRKNVGSPSRNASSSRPRTKASTSTATIHPFRLDQRAARRTDSPRRTTACDPSFQKYRGLNGARMASISAAKGVAPARCLSTNPRLSSSRSTGHAARTRRSHV